LEERDKKSKENPAALPYFKNFWGIKKLVVSGGKELISSKTL
jgi:hypothetical protein